MKKAITVKCAKCGQDIVIDKNSLDEIIYFDKLAWHENCFIETIPQKQKSKSKAIRDRWLAANDMEKIHKLSRNHYLVSLYKDDVYNYIRDQYKITVIPQFIWMKLASIYDGTFKGMSVGITPDILLDMWQRKMNYLNKQYQQNVVKGKSFNACQRISYDLSVLVNKYDSYIAFIEKQKIMAAEAIEKARQEKDTNLTSFIIKENTISNNSNEDLSDLVEDIFS